MNRYAYLQHLLVWIGPFLIVQWLVGWRIFLRNKRAVVAPALVAGTYYTATDFVAIRSGIWFFDENQLLGLGLGPVPVEEALFFFLTALLVSQSVVLLLPDRYRHPARRRHPER